MVDDVENLNTSPAAAGNSINENGALSSNTKFQVVTTVPTNEVEDNADYAHEEDVENPIQSESGGGVLSFEKAIDDNNDNPTQTQTTTNEEVKRNINSYYGHKVGAISTISLILNAGLMIYAHLGLSAVILSSRDPSLTAGIIRRTTHQQQQQQSRTLQQQEVSKCNSNDLQNWIKSGGEITRPIKSNYCSREYNGGCFLDATCIEKCFVEEHGYSEQCSECFGRVPGCSIDNGCLLSCAADSLGEACKQCNTPCIEELQVCTGLPDPLPEIIEKDETETVDETIDTTEESTAPTIDGKCNEEDVSIWNKNNGETSRPEQSNFCSRTYNGGCFLNSDCIESCFQSIFGYSEECSVCFGQVPGCSVSSGCTTVCAANSLGDECRECNKPCVEVLNVCTGLPQGVTDNNESDATSPQNNEAVTIDDKDNTPIVVPPPNQAIGADDNACNDFDLEAIDTWYTVYELTFVESIRDAWEGDAKLLAVIIVLFSGIWPYLKNIILVIIWYTPATIKTQNATLLWLSRLSKYTLVDVFAVIGVLVGVQLQLNVGGTEAVTRAEPRFGIIAFFIATVWEFIQIEWVKVMHERVLPPKNETGEDRLFFSKLWMPVLILLVSLSLYIAGAIMEVVYFASADLGSDGVCKRSYNLVTLGNALINEISLTSNSAPGQTWILYLSYVALILLFPILVHALQICFIVGWFKSNKFKRLINWTLAIWFFACVDVLLIGVFAVEYKFPNLIMKIAGDTNSSFLDIDSNLGIGFYILIAYSVVAGFLQFSLRIRNDDKSTEQSMIQGEANGDEKENS